MSSNTVSVCVHECLKLKYHVISVIIKNKVFTCYFMQHFYHILSDGHFQLLSILCIIIELQLNLNVKKIKIGSFLPFIFPNLVFSHFFNSFFQFIYIFFFLLQFIYFLFLPFCSCLTNVKKYRYFIFHHLICTGIFILKQYFTMLIKVPLCVFEWF